MANLGLYGKLWENRVEGTENPRVGSSNLSLGTTMSGGYEVFRNPLLCFVWIAGIHPISPAIGL